jgi:hypothetical protein
MQRALLIWLLIPACAAEGSKDDTSLVADSGTASADVRDSGEPDVAFNVDATAMDVATEPATDVEVIITSDNAYSFGWGDKNRINTFNFRTPSTTAEEIFSCASGPEKYTIPAAEAPISAYLYVIAWSDRSVTQGAVGQFQRKGGTPIFTGTEKWEVCATGDGSYVAPANGPAKDVVNAEITKCNAGSGSKDTTSGGWVSNTGPITPGAVGLLAIGEDNSTDRTAITAANPFPIACNIDPKAHWMWYAAPGDMSPFISTGGNTSREFLIFRLPTAAIPTVK